MEREKTNTWRKHLSTLTIDTLFQAKKHATDTKKSSLISTLIDTDGNRCTTNKAKAQMLFNATCIATTSCELNDVNATPFPRRPKLLAKYFPNPTLSLSHNSIRDALNTTHQLKAPGPDRIQNWVWMVAWDLIGEHITTLFRAVVNQGFIPPRWKLAKAIMLDKPDKDDYTQPGSYRPIALINTLAKVFEKTITPYMSQIAEAHQVLHSGHYGARPGRLSQEALIRLVSWIKAHWRAGRIVGAIFADVTSAFPSIHHPRMIHTLETQGFPLELINIIQSFLAERKTYLSFNGFDS